MMSFNEMFERAKKENKIGEIYKLAEEVKLPPNLIRIFEYEKKNGFTRILLIIIIRSITCSTYISRFSKSSLTNDLLLFFGNLFDINSTVFLKEMDKDFVKTVLLADFHKMLSKLDSETLIENRRIINNYYLNQLKIWNSYNKLISESVYILINVIYPIAINSNIQDQGTCIIVAIYVVLEIIIRYKSIMKDNLDSFNEIDDIKNKILKYTTEVLNNNNIIIEYNTLSEHANTIVDLISKYIDSTYDNNIFICQDYIVGNKFYDMLEKVLFMVTKRLLKYDPILYTNLFYTIPSLVKSVTFTMYDLNANMTDNVVYDKILAIKHEKVERENLFRESRNLFTIHNLEKSYGKNLLFKNGNISIPQAKWTSFIGNSGCGKSTLIKILLMKESFDSGSVIFCDEFEQYEYRNICNAISNVRNTGDIFDETVFYNITYGINITSETMQRIYYYMDKFKMDDVLLTDKISSVSSGQQQRIKLIRMILSDKPVWIMDESTSNIDNETEYDILYELRRIQIEKKKTVIHITHNLENRCFADLCMRIKDKHIHMSNM